MRGIFKNWVTFEEALEENAQCQFNMFAYSKGTSKKMIDKSN